MIIKEVVENGKHYLNFPILGNLELVKKYNHDKWIYVSKNKDGQLFLFNEKSSVPGGIKVCNVYEISQERFDFLNSLKALTSDVLDQNDNDFYYKVTMDFKNIDKDYSVDANVEKIIVNKDEESAPESN